MNAGTVNAGNIPGDSPRQTRKGLAPILILLLTLLLDQLSKSIISTSVHLGESVPVLGSVIKLTYIRNPRGAFGLPLGGNIIFTIVSVLAILLILYILWTVPGTRTWSRLALSLVLGGAMGNLLDRLRLGEVIDFIDIGVGTTRWPVFNVADIGVTVGAALLCYAMFLKKESWHGETPEENRS